MISPEPSSAPLGAMVRLRPRDRGGILDLAFRLYRKEFITLLAIVAVVYVPAELLMQAISVMLLGHPTGYLYAFSGFGRQDLSTAPTNAGVIGLLLFYGVRYLVPLVRGFLMYPGQGAITAAVEDEYLGRATSLAGAYRRVTKRIAPLMGLMGVKVLITVGAYVLPFALFDFVIRNARANYAAGCVSGLLVLSAAVLYLYVAVRLQLAVPAFVVEGLGPTKALSRSWQLVQGNWWRTFGLLVFTLTLLGLVISEGPGFLIRWVIGNFVHLDAAGDQALSAIVGGTTTMLFLPVEFLVIAVYYFDLRIRQEGFDLETAVAQRYAVGEARPAAHNQEPVPAAPGGVLWAADAAEDREGPISAGEHATAMSAAWAGRAKIRQRPKRYLRVNGSEGPGARANHRLHPPGEERGGS